MPAQLGTFVLPRPPALPAQGVAGQQVFVGGVVWTHDGTRWGKGSTASTRVVVDVGRRGKREHTVTLGTDLTVGDRVTGWIGYGATPGKSADEYELDAVHVWCAVTAAGLTIRLVGLTGPIAGEFPVDLLTTKG